eukprot:994144-Prymnesium_polylepis.2
MEPLQGDWGRLEADRAGGDGDGGRLEAEAKWPLARQVLVVAQREPHAARDALGRSRRQRALSDAVRAGEQIHDGGGGEQIPPPHAGRHVVVDVDRAREEGAARKRHNASTGGPTGRPTWVVNIGGVEGRTGYTCRRRQEVVLGKLVNVQTVLQGVFH